MADSSQVRSVAWQCELHVVAGMLLVASHSYLVGGNGGGAGGAGGEGGGGEGGGNGGGDSDTYLTRNLPQLPTLD
jgi:hypothetical protein